MRRPAPWLLLSLAILGGWAYTSTPLRKAVREWLDSEKKILAWEGPIAKAPGPNVLIVVLDTTRRDALSPYGGSERATPAARALARKGIVFDSCFSAASFSAPSYASLLTGTWPATHRVLDQPEFLDAENRTVLEAAREAGYYTLFFTQHRYLRERWGFPQGALYYRYHPDSEALEAELQDWIQTHPDKPFFAFLAMIDPHWPYQDWTDGKGIEASLPPRDRNLVPNTSVYDMKYGFEETGLSPRFAQARRRAYQSEVEHDDHLVERLLESLKETGRRRNTIVVYAGDHGETFGEHGFHFVHDCEVHAEVSMVPLIISWPDRLAAARVSAPVSLVDVYPSLVDWIGADPGNRVEGRALPLNDQEGSSGGIRACYTRPFQADRAGYPAIRERFPCKGWEGSTFLGVAGPWALILQPAAKGITWEAFDRLRDPLQEKNLWDEVRGDPEILRLQASLKAFRDRFLDASRREPARFPAPDKEKELQELGYLDNF